MTETVDAPIATARKSDHRATIAMAVVLVVAVAGGIVALIAAV